MGSDKNELDRCIRQLEREGLIRTTEHRRSRRLLMVTRGYEDLLPAGEIAEDHVKYIAEGLELLSEEQPALKDMTYDIWGRRKTSIGPTTHSSTS